MGVLESMKTREKTDEITDLDWIHNGFAKILQAQKESRNGDCWMVGVD